uniref:Uncharacterized protein n=1 Tax=Bionectria ochroleuca TaxID=29856 RepID=A0A8H7NMI4_BIOOC
MPSRLFQPFFDEIAPQDRFLKLWTASTWRDPCYRCPPSVLPPSDNPAACIRAAILVCNMPLLARLPHNVQHMIFELCGDPLPWRYTTVCELARRMNCDPFFDGTLSLDEIHTWSRRRVPTLSQTLDRGQPSEVHGSRLELPVAEVSNEGYILLVVDSQGLRDILRVAELVDSPGFRSEKLRFISGPAESFSGFFVDFKYGLARLIVPSGRQVQVWESEVPPDSQMIIDPAGPSPDLAPHTSLFFAASHFVSIDLEKCDGLTVFSSPMVCLVFMRTHVKVPML